MWAEPFAVVHNLLEAKAIPRSKGAIFDASDDAWHGAEVQSTTAWEQLCVLHR